MFMFLYVLVHNPVHPFFLTKILTTSLRLPYYPLSSYHYPTTYYRYPTTTTTTLLSYLPSSSPSSSSSSSPPSSSSSSFTHHLIHCFLDLFCPTSTRLPTFSPPIFNYLFSSYNIAILSYYIILSTVGHLPAESAEVETC